MLRLLITLAFVLSVSGVTLAQNTNSSTTKTPSTSNNNLNPQKPSAPRKAAPKPSATRSAPVKPPPPTATDAGSGTVVAAFNKLLDGIRSANVDAVTEIYWKSPRLILFNNNGTVTKGWDQVRKNRESSYPELKDVKLDVRDVSVIMLGRDGAVVSCLWTQSQTYKGTPETATGRMSLVFRRTPSGWQAVHLHTSPDKEDPSRVLPSEQASPTPTPPGN